VLSFIFQMSSRGSVYLPSFTKTGAWFQNLASIEAFFKAGEGICFNTDTHFETSLYTHEIRRYHRSQTLELFYEVPWSSRKTRILGQIIKLRYRASGAKRGFLLAYWRWEPGLRNLVENIYRKISKQYLKTLLMGSKSLDTPFYRFFRHPLCERQVLRIVGEFAGW